jgi:hypothetical protein
MSKHHRQCKKSIYKMRGNKHRKPENLSLDKAEVLGTTYQPTGALADWVKPAHKVSLYTYSVTIGEKVSQ